MNPRLSVAIGLWLVLAGLAVFALLKTDGFTRRNWRTTLALFTVVLAVAFPVWRWCSLTYNGEINVDESMVLAQALKYERDWMPWRSVVADAGGPLNTWVLFWVKPFGLDFGYLTARLTGLLLMFSLAIATVLSIAEMVPKRQALLFSLPLTSLLLATLNLDFLHFSSEQFPAALCAWAVWLLLKQRRTPTREKALVLGILCGALPYTKIQALLGAAFLFAAGAALPWVRAKHRDRWRRILAWQFAGGLIPSVIILVPVAAGGAFGDFLHFYIDYAFGYKNTQAGGFSFQLLTRGDEGFTVVFYGALVFAALSLGALAHTLVHGKKISVPLRAWVAGFGLCAGHVAVWMFSVLKSGFGFPHYLMFLLSPVALLSACCASRFANRAVAFRGRLRGTAVAVATVVSAALVLQLAVVSSRNQRFLSNWGKEVHPVAEFLKSRCQPGDTVAIWGWAAKINVLTQLAPATRFAHTCWVIDPAPQFQRHRMTFLSDLQAARPKVFLDAVDEFRWYSWPPGVAARHTMLPELSTWIFKNYDAVGEIQTAQGRLPVRIYFLKTPKD